MPLSFPGDFIPNSIGFSLLGYDIDTRQAIVVKASNAAIEKFGQPLIKERAGRKYDSGLVSGDGAVEFHVSDFE